MRNAQQPYTEKKAKILASCDQLVAAKELASSNKEEVRETALGRHAAKGAGKEKEGDGGRRKRAEKGEGNTAGARGVCPEKKIKIETGAEKSQIVFAEPPPTADELIAPC